MRLEMIFCNNDKWNRIRIMGEFLDWCIFINIKIVLNYLGIINCILKVLT